MSKLQWLLRSVAAVLVAGTLAVGSAQALSSQALGPVCMDDWWEIGYCPPYTEETCEDACYELFGSPDAECGPPGNTCCTCVV